MRSRCITNFVNGLHGCIAGCIKSDGIFCTGNIQIDGSRDTYCIDAIFRQLLGSTERTVSSDYYHTINSVFTADICCLFLSFRCTHFLTAGCEKDRTTSLYNICNAHGMHINNIFFQKSCVTTADSFYFQSTGQCRTHDSTDGCIHSRCIPTACHYSDCLNLFRHCKTSKICSFLPLDLPFILHSIHLFFNTLFHHFYIVCSQSVP